MQHERLGSDANAARVQPREVQQLLEQPAQTVALLVGNLQQLLAELGLELVAALDRRRERAVHRRRRRPQLVRRHRDEVRLQLVEHDHLLVQSRALSGERDTFRDEAEQLHVVLVELPRPERSDVQHADHVTAHDERHAEHRLDALLPQDRVHDLGVVDVVEDHRLRGGRDATGKAATDRDPNALLDLFFDSECGAREQLGPLVVQQQHCTRVGLEDVADSRQRADAVWSADLPHVGTGSRCELLLEL